MNELLESILNDNQFTTIMNNDILNEGEQADAYRARKEQERADRERAEKERYNRRYGKDGFKSPGDKHDSSLKWPDVKKDLDRDHRAGERVLRDTHAKIDKAKNNLDDEHAYRNVMNATNRDNQISARDAANRHERRHGITEDFEDIDFIEID